MNAPLAPGPLAHSAAASPLAATAIMRFGDCELHLPTRELWRNGERQPVRRRVFDLITFLIGCRPAAATHADIARTVWGRQDVRSAVIAQAVLQARRASGDSLDQPTHFVSVHGVGYRFAAALKAGVGDSTDTTSSDAMLGALRAALDEAHGASQRGDNHSALFLAERAISLAERAGANTLKARALNIASTAALHKGTLAVAAGYAYQALRIAQAEDNRPCAAESRTCIAQSLYAGADLYGALQMLQAMGPVHEAQDAQAVSAVALRVESLSRMIHGDLQQFDQAHAWSERALRTSWALNPERRATTEHLGAVNLLLKEPEAAQDAGDHMRAQSLFEQALAYSQGLAADIAEVGGAVGHLCWLGNLSLALAGLGRLEEAWQHAEAANRRMQCWPNQDSPWYLTHLGELRLQRAAMLGKASRTEEALEEIEAGIKGAAASGLHDQVPRFATLASHVCEAAGRPEAALRWLRRAGTAQQHQRREKAALLAAVYQAARDNESLGLELQALRSTLVTSQAKIQQLSEQLQVYEQRGWAGGSPLTPEAHMISALQQRHQHATTHDLPCMVGLVSIQAPAAGPMAAAVWQGLASAAATIRNHLGDPLLPVGIWADKALVFPLDGMGERRARLVCAELQQQLAAAADTDQPLAAGLCTRSFNLALPLSFDSALADLRRAANSA